MVNGGVPSLKELYESKLRLNDPAGEYGPGRLGVPALMVEGVVYIVGRNGTVCEVGDDLAGSNMLKQAREQIERDIAAKLRETGY